MESYYEFNRNGTKFRDNRCYKKILKKKDSQNRR